MVQGMASREYEAMNKRVENYILWLNRFKAGRKRAMSLVLAMSVVVSGNVFWFMRGVGTALADEPSCGIDEHVHSTDCYEKTLVCDLDHEHTEECYETRLICGMEEHTHTDACYFTEDLQRENTDDWEKTLPVRSGVYSNDLMNCAISQIGYKENDDGYTRYGDWYGNSTADWNVMFVSFCMHYAGITQDQIPGGAGCWAWQVKLEESDLLLTDLTVLPGPGDILLTDNDGDGKCDRAGIVIDITEGIIGTVEGDIEGVVGTCTYAAENAAIYGYVSVNSLNTSIEQPENQSSAATAQITPADTDAIVNTSPATPSALSNVTEYTAVTGSGIEVRATAPEGAFPDGATMSASDVNDEDIIAQAEGAAAAEESEIKGSIAVDITFTDKEGNETEPAEGMAIDVNIVIPEDRQLEANGYQLFHIDAEGATEVEGALVSQSEARFTAESFSIYVVTATGQRDKNKVHAWIENAGMGPLTDHREYDPATNTYGDYIVNDAEYPYVLKVGDVITLVGHNENQTPRFVIETDNWNNFSNWHTNIQIVEQPAATGNDVTCVIEAVGSTGWNAPVRIRLEGTDEYFYIQVNDYDAGDYVLDLDSTPQYDFNPNNIPTYYVQFGTNVTITGTPSAYDYGAWGIFLDTNENPNGWVISNNAEEHTLANGDREWTFTANVYVDGNDNSQIFTMQAEDGTWRKIRITETVNGEIDHADIEIADGGVYTNVQIEGGDNGELYKTVTEYQSYVYDVNYSEMRDANNNVVQFYDHSNSYAPLATSRFIGGRKDDGDFNDYWSDYRYVPGSSQYELTSKYTVPPNVLFDVGPVRWSQKRFFYQEVDTAIFDVELQIIPKHTQKYVWNANTNGWDPVSGTNVEYDIQYNQGTGGSYRMRTDNGEWTEYQTLKPKTEGGIVEYKNEVFNLNHQAVIDAYNKCPNHSGLDFTVHHDLATIEFTASKELTGRTLADQEFLFRIYPSVEEAVSTVTPAPTGIASARNDADGKVVFGNIEFENVSGEHTYTYYMKEIPGDDDTLVYDPVIYKIVIDVNKVYQGAGPGGTDLVVPVDIRSFERLKPGGDPMVDADYLPADQFKFNNAVKFTLPDTGGGGIVPYLATGTVLIGGALILLMLRRRKEVDL